jgi:3-oxoadipate enol-lactonase
MTVRQLPDGRLLAFAEHGAGEPALLLLHPVGLSGACWATLAAKFAGRHRVLAPDLPGHGGSDPPDGDYTIEALADDVAELLRGEESRPALVAGLSMGGVVALALAQRHPDLVAAVAVVNSLTKVPAPMVPFLEERAARIRSDGMAAVTDETLARWFTPGFAERDPETVAETERQLRTADPDVHADAWLALAAVDLGPGLGELKQPVLVVTGALDPSATAEAGARLAASVPDGAHVHLEAAGHLSPLEEPARVAEVLCSFFDRPGLR